MIQFIQALRRSHIPPIYLLSNNRIPELVSMPFSLHNILIDRRN